MSPVLSGMRLDGISAHAPAEVWSNARVAARLRLERIRMRSRRDGRLSPEQALDLNRQFQGYLQAFGDLQKLARPMLEELAKAEKKIAP